MNNNYEIERKYLIKKPDISFISKKADRILEITQTYLGQNEKGFNCRVRKIIENGEEKYIFTEKKGVSAIVRIENEYEIDLKTYDELIKNKQLNRNVIEKTRYCINRNGLVYEIDVYPFWEKQAVMEVELENENDVPPPLKFIEIIKDVTEEKGYSNFAMSLKIPNEL